MSELKPIQSISTAKMVLSEVEGQVGDLRQVPIEKLGVNPAYQRQISRRSVRVIRRIVSGFHWSRFLPVIVVPQGDGFAIVDGQHRVTAALTLGITEVPCYVLSCSLDEAAGAFAAINGDVTPVTPQDIWFAQLEAGDPEALDLKRVLEAGGVAITRNKESFKVGETRSISVLRRAYKKYEQDILILALQAITETNDGNPGLINGAVVNGICKAIAAKTRVMNAPEAFFKVMDGVNLPEMIDDAREENLRTGNPLQFIITREINALLRDAGLAR